MSVLVNIQEEASVKEESVKGKEINYLENPNEFSGAKYLRECCMKLNASVVTMCTAITYYHRFYNNVNFEDYDPYLIACTCIYLASKVKNDDLKIRDIINVGYHTIHRNRSPLSLDPYFELRDSLVESELLLMRMLKFDLHVDLPHKYLLFYLNTLKDWMGPKMSQDFPIAQISWTLLLDIHQVPVVLKYSPQAIAAAVIFLTFQIYGIRIPGAKNLGESRYLYRILNP
ncbi:hypothetical protein Avbf_16724 [Armadillidium vulgare]|nr:hypothetical protein Avbf_16724 [Armadillidium vulgare]